MCSPTVVHFIIKETTQMIWMCLKNEVFPKLIRETLEETASGFETRWNLPNCVGAVDGKHITIQVLLCHFYR